MCQTRVTEDSRDKAEAVEINRLLEFCNENGMFNGTILVSKNNEVIYRKAFGYANLETNEELNPESAFYLASVSKQFTTMAVMILKEQNQLTYEDKLSDYFPEFPHYADEVTIRHMMTHTSGIPDHYGLDAYKPDLKNSDVLELLVKQDTLDFKPGDKYSYSNGGYVLLSMIVEKASGIPFHKFMETNIFEPLEMESTLVFDESKPTVKNRAIGYNSAGDLDDYEILTTGAGGMYSTVDDLFLWDQALYTEKLTSQATLNEAFKTTRLNDGEYSDYGFGWGVNEEENTVQHSGGLNGYRTFLKRYLERNDSYMLLTNNGDAIAMGGINDAINNILSGSPYELPKVPISNKLSSLLKTTDFETAASQVKELLAQEPKTYQNDELGVNSLGYSYLNDDDTDMAIAIFGLNIELTPASSNVWDSMGEALLKQGDTAASIANYKESILLNPNNTNAVSLLVDLGEDEQDLIPYVTVSQEVLESYVGDYELEPDFILTILHEDSQLFVFPTGQSKFELFAVSKTRFYLKVVNAQVTFNEDDSGKISSLTLHQGGDQEAPKVK